MVLDAIEHQPVVLLHGRSELVGSKADRLEARKTTLLDHRHPSGLPGWEVAARAPQSGDCDVGGR
jgi:hypothetical protein